MLRIIIKSFLFLPFFLSFTYQKSVLSDAKNYIDEILKEKENKILIDFKEIEKLILQNQELKSLQELVQSASFNLSSKISQKYPSIDLQASGLPKYTRGINYNSNLPTTKTSQFSANPSINIRWDLIDPIRGSEIKIARENYKIAKNNFEIKRKDLIQEARSSYHKYQKSFKDIENKKFALDLSITSLNNAKSKLDAGVGTKFEVLEADAQLSRDKQSLNEKKIQHRINKIALQEILNIKKDLIIKQKQTIIGFWNYQLNENIKNGLAKNLSLENLLLQKEINKRQANIYLDSNKPNIYLSNTFSSAFTKGDTLSSSIDSSKYGSSYTNTVSINLSWNFFNGGRNKNSYKSSKSKAKAEEYSYKSLTNVLRTRISKAYFNLRLNEEKILSSRKEIASTKESLRLSRLRYDVGISTLKDVLSKQKELSNANSKNINAIYNYNLNLHELERLTFLEVNNECIKNNTIKSIESICDIPR